MSLFSLSLEIREMYTARAETKSEQHERKRAALDAKKAALTEEDEEKEEKQEEEEEEEDDDDEYVRKIIAAVPPIPISVLSANRQISREATPILFRHNRFSFDLAAEQTHTFLKNQDIRATKLIKDIRFGRNSALDSDCCWYWADLSKFMDKQMRINTVTIAVPSSSRHKIIRQGDRNRAPNAFFYWWPAVDTLFDLLLRGRIQELRLSYPDTYGKPKERRTLDDGSDEFCLVSLSEFSIISRLMHGCRGQSFAVRREDALIGVAGTVLVLTVPDVRKRSN